MKGRSSATVNNSFMFLQIDKSSEGNRANFAFKGSFITVNVTMVGQTARCLEGNSAKFAFERSFIAVSQVMIFQHG